MTVNTEAPMGMNRRCRRLAIVRRKRRLALASRGDHAWLDHEPSGLLLLAAEADEVRWALAGTTQGR